MDLHLLLVGDGMSRAALEQLVQQEDAAGYVTFYGSVPATDVPRFTTLADALIVSLSDSPDLGLTVPGKVASYMAAGKPVLASMDGAGADAVRAAGCGMCPPPATRTPWRTTCAAVPECPPTAGPSWAALRKVYYLENYRRSLL